MHTWYRAVCDECKEACHVLVTSTDHVQPEYIADKEIVVMQFLSRHCSHNMRLVWSDEDLDYLHDNQYYYVDDERKYVNGKPVHFKKYDEHGYLVEGVV